MKMKSMNFILVGFFSSITFSRQKKYFKAINDNIYKTALEFNPIRVGFLGGSFSDGGRRGKINPCLKPVRIKLETWTLVYKYTHICSLRKYAF